MSQARVGIEAPIVGPKADAPITGLQYSLGDAAGQVGRNESEQGLATAEAEGGGAKVGRVPLENLGKPDDLGLRINGHAAAVRKCPRRQVKLFVNVVGVIHSNRWTRAGI